jgi:hypothetical protein
MELIEQCVNDLAKVGISNVGVIRGDDDRVNPNATVQVASLQTLQRRDKPPAGILLIDEAHRSLGDGYLALIDHYVKQGAIVLGFTATPIRVDGRPMGNVYECMEVIVSYEQLIKEGHIVAPYCYGSSFDLDLSKVAIIGNDYDENQLGDLMRSESLVGRLLDHWKALANIYRAEGNRFVVGPYRRTFIFAVSVVHSIAIRDKFASAGVRIGHLDGTTSEKERKHLLRAIAAGDIDAITSVGVLLEGIDIPSIKCVVGARPTQSLVIHRQAGGRMLRPWHPGCSPGCRAHPSVEPLYLDHANNILVHGFPHEDLHWELTSKSRVIQQKIATRVCPSCYAYIPAYKQTCPYCGAESKPAEPSDLPRETEQELQRLAVVSPEEMRKLYFRTIYQVARVKGHKPGFCAVRYKERYGSWPPWEWSNYLKELFASDPEWQANYAKKVARKKKHAEEKEARELAKIEQQHPEEPEGTGSFEDNDDIAF